MESQICKYFAFISYNSHDIEWGKKLQKKLESYKMSAKLCKEHGWKRKPIKPMFFAPTDIQPGGLTEELQERLRASKNLIVICSPHSARSEWVGKEIEFFYNLGRLKQIHFFIVDGEPNSGDPETECFNPIISKLGIPEILGVNIHEQTQTYPYTSVPWPWLNKERAYVQLITKLLGIEFDNSWQRHKRLLIQKTFLWALATLLVLLSLMYVWNINRPIDVSVQLEEVSAHNVQLPPLKDAFVIMTLDNEIKSDTVDRLSDVALFPNIPHKYLGKDVRIQVECKDFIRVDTMLTLSAKNQIKIRRNESVYGDVHFRLWNPNIEKGISNCNVDIDGHTVCSDNEGNVNLHIPLAQQKVAYKIKTTIFLESDSIFMPCGSDDVVLTK